MVGPVCGKIFSNKKKCVIAKCFLLLFKKDIVKLNTYLTYSASANSFLSAWYAKNKSFRLYLYWLAGDIHVI